MNTRLESTVEVENMYTCIIVFNDASKQINNNKFKQR